MTSVSRSPEHPVLEDAWKHELVGFHYDGLADEPYIDLVLRHAETKAIRRLRFLSPREISLNGPHMNWGLAIADVRQRQMGGIGVEVYNFENSQGSAEFYARDVIDVTEP
jgi:hypothetical protein